MYNCPTRRAGFVIIGLVALGVPLTGCSGGSPSPAGQQTSSDCVAAHPDVPTVTPGTLTVNAYISPPYTIEDGSTVNGIDGLIVQEIAKMECLQLVVNATAGAALPASIDAGRADMAIGGVLYNDERAASFSLTDTMYYDGLGFLSKDGLDTVDAVAEGKLGLIQGYAVNDEFIKALGEDHVTIYQTSASLIADIKNGRVDAGSFSSSEAFYRAKEDPTLKAAIVQPDPRILESNEPSNVVLFLKKTSTDLTSALNEDIATMLGNGAIEDALTANGIDASMAAKPSS